MIEDELRAAYEELLRRFIDAQVKVISEYSGTIGQDIRALHDECVAWANTANVEVPPLPDWFEECWGDAS